ncbi:MAG: hypothetical protein Q9214_004374 [Letrouitia sp. 1 TL-2023]
MEFHLPYYALRQSQHQQIDPRGLRRSGRFIPKRSTQGLQDWFYEAQISILVTGIDEWFWTAYCFVDTYFGSEETVENYYDRGLDALTGGQKSLHYPVWNPRGYFLQLLSFRLEQATKEWSNVVDALDDRLQHHEERIFDEPIGDDASLTDEDGFPRTREYTRTIELLRLLHNSLVKFIESWERFEDGEIQYFNINEQNSLRRAWGSHLAGIEKNINELKFLRRSLQQRIETFDTMRTGVRKAF